MGKTKIDSLRRRGPRREPLPRFLVVCEGEVTEKEYVSHLRHTERIPISLTVEAGGTPKTLVETAVRLMKKPPSHKTRMIASTKFGACSTSTSISKSLTHESKPVTTG